MPQKPHQNPSRQFSFIYSKLVTDQDDLIGVIAYSLYKGDKVNFIKIFIEQNNRPPNEQEIYAFQLDKSSDHGVQVLRERAEQQLKRATEEVFRTKTIEFFESALPSHPEVKRILESRIPKLRTFWGEVGGQIIVSLVNTVLIALFFAMLLWWQNQNVIELLKQILTPSK